MMASRCALWAFFALGCIGFGMWASVQPWWGPFSLFALVGGGLIEYVLVSILVGWRKA